MEIIFLPLIAGQCSTNGNVDIWNSRGSSQDKSRDESQNVWRWGKNQSRRRYCRPSLQNQAKLSFQTLWRLDHASDKGSSGWILIEKVGLDFSWHFNLSFRFIRIETGFCFYLDGELLRMCWYESYLTYLIYKPKQAQQELFQNMFILGLFLRWDTLKWVLSRLEVDLK